jgi:hypothetical protein
LTVSVSPDDGGEIRVEGEIPDSYPHEFIFDDGLEVEVEAVSAPGYSFSHWSEDLTGSDNATSIIMNCNKYVTANFIRVTRSLAVEVSNNNGGEVELDPPQPAEGYEVGTEVVLTAVAEDGFTFDRWVGALSGCENPVTITMDTDKTITAAFAEKSSTFPWWWLIIIFVVVMLSTYFFVIRRI